MNVKHFFILICLYFIPSTNFSVAAQDLQSGSRAIVWSDEFSIDGKPDSGNWNYEKGFVRNREFQWYQEDNAYCKDGFLIIEARRERVKNSHYNTTSDNWRKNRKYAEYTSSSLLTKGLHSWKFGRFEMRAKIVTSEGLWPAFWTLGIDGNWPHNGEIDIMEYYDETILANIAWGGEKRGQAIWDAYRYPMESLIAKDPDWSNKFHLWRMDWDKDGIKLFLDDMLLNSVSLSETNNKDKEAKNPFLQPHYIIVNLAIGGTKGGNPTATKFPNKYIIDYIRIYQ